MKNKTKLTQFSIKCLTWVACKSLNASTAAVSSLSVASIEINATRTLFISSTLSCPSPFA